MNDNPAFETVHTLETEDPHALTKRQDRRVTALYHAKGLLEHRETKGAFAGASVIPANANDLILLADYIVEGPLR